MFWWIKKLNFLSPPPPLNPPCLTHWGWRVYTVTININEFPGYTLYSIQYTTHSTVLYTTDFSPPAPATVELSSKCPMFAFSRFFFLAQTCDENKKISCTRKYFLALRFFCFCFVPWAVRNMCMFCYWTTLRAYLYDMKQKGGPHPNLIHVVRVCTVDV